MRLELRNEILSVLEELSEGRASYVFLTNGNLRFEAILLLREYGALEASKKGGSFKITIMGYDMYERLKAPRAYWAKKNWFPVGVLVVSVVVPVVSSLIVVWLS